MQSFDLVCASAGDRPPGGAPSMNSDDLLGGPARPARVLVVDDNVDLARTIELGLVDAGHVVKLASGAEDALEILDRDDSIEVVLSDIRMPDVDGYSLIRIVRHRYPAVGVLLMSAFPWSQEDVIPRGVMILGKPYDLETLGRTIEKVRREAQASGRA